MLSGVARHQLPEPSRKVRGGLGLVPRRLNGAGELWRRKWTWDDICQRVDRSHAPYHRFVEQTLYRMREKFGGAILLDVHSMPPLTDEKKGDVDIVIGDRFGRSAGSRYSEIALAYCNQSGMRSQLNHPYAGGYILERHGKPDDGIHALQLEIDRRCYLDKALLEPGDGFAPDGELRGEAGWLACKPGFWTLAIDCRRIIVRLFDTVSLIKKNHLAVTARWPRFREVAFLRTPAISSIGGSEPLPY